VPSASGTTARSYAAAAASAATRSSPTSAGRSPRSTATPWRPVRGTEDSASRPAETAALRPPPGSLTTHAPRLRASAATAGSEVTTWTRPGGIPRQAAVRQSRAMANASSARETPAGGCSRDLAAAPPFTGTTRCQSTGAVGVIDTIVPSRGALLDSDPLTREDAVSTPSGLE